MEQKDIANVINGLLGAIDDQNKETFRALSDTPAIQEALEKVRTSDAEGFFFALLYPLENAIDGLLSSELPGNSKAQFLFSQGQFVERHFEKLFEKHEGSACCADKSRTIVRSLLRFLTTGKRIEFNYEAEYTYHLPRRIFRTHEEIVTFYDALLRLYYGRSEPYLEAMRQLDVTLAASTPSE
jgi:hypothetical protein